MAGTPGLHDGHHTVQMGVGQELGSRVDHLIDDHASLWGFFDHVGDQLVVAQVCFQDFLQDWGEVGFDGTKCIRNGVTGL